MRSAIGARSHLNIRARAQTFTCTGERQCPRARKRVLTRRRWTPLRRNGPARLSPVREPDFIEVKGAHEHNLQIDELLDPQAQAGGVHRRQRLRASRASRSTPSTPRASAATSRASRPTRASSSGQLERPKIEHLRGLSPTIAIEQKSASNNPRSTVGTITEIYDYLRVLYARVGTQHCHRLRQAGAQRQRPSRSSTRSWPKRQGKLSAVRRRSSPTARASSRDLFEELRGRGFLRVEVDGEVAPPRRRRRKLDKKLKHTIELVVDRITVRAEDRRRLTESVEPRAARGQGRAARRGRGQGRPGSRCSSPSRARCCGVSFPELSPQSASRSTARSACAADCNGLGTRMEVDARPGRPRPELSHPRRRDRPVGLGDGARRGLDLPHRRGAGEGLQGRPRHAVEQAAEEEARHGAVRRSGRQEDRRQVGQARAATLAGHLGHAVRGRDPQPRCAASARPTSEAAREHYRKFLREVPCDACDGKRLRAGEPGGARVAGTVVADVTALTVPRRTRTSRALRAHRAAADHRRGRAARDRRRASSFLLNVGPRLPDARSLGADAVGRRGAADPPREPARQRARRRDVRARRAEHRPPPARQRAAHRDAAAPARSRQHRARWSSTTRTPSARPTTWSTSAPARGTSAARSSFSGTAEALDARRESLTGAYLSGRARASPMPDGAPPREGRDHRGRGAPSTTCRDVDVTFPLGVPGRGHRRVSGAGKSSLVNGILLPALSSTLHGSARARGQHKRSAGLEQLDKVIAIDQQPDRPHAARRTPARTPRRST